MKQTIGQLLDSEQIGLTVYSPDATHSQLWGNLDQTIHEETGFQPVFRQWVVHDYNSIMRFYTSEGEPKQVDDPIEAGRKYDTMPIGDIQYGHLVVKHLLSAPSLLTLWQGDEAVSTLLTLKGVTHPAEATIGTIRGLFWIDNAVLNLVHSSDSIAEVQRELTALGFADVLKEAPQTISLIDPRIIPKHYIAHSGIVVLCEVVRRAMFGQGITPLEVTLPESGDANETMAHCTTVLEQFLLELPESHLADFIRAYLAGEFIIVCEHLDTLPATKWEKFVIQCGAINRDKWVKG